MTEAAKVVGQVKGQPAYSLPQGMKNIEILFQKEMARQQQLPKAVAATPVVAVCTCSTRSYPRFPLSHPEMKGLSSPSKVWMESESHPKMLMLLQLMDVSKFLKYSSPSQLNWLQLLDTAKISVMTMHAMLF